MGPGRSWMDRSFGSRSVEDVERRRNDPPVLGIRPTLQDSEDPIWIFEKKLEPALCAFGSEVLELGALIHSHDR